MSLPRWVPPLVRFFTPPARVDDLLGDLDEVHRVRVRRHGDGIAAALTALEVVDTGAALMIGRFRRRAPVGNRRTTRAPNPGMGIYWLDVKLGLHMLLRHPVLSAVSVLPTAIAIAAAAGMHSVSANMLHPRLPLPEGERIVSVELWNVATGAPEPRALYDFARWRGQLQSIEHLGAFETYRPNLVDGDGRSEPVFGSKISASAFQIAQVPPLLGRTLSEEDERLGGPDVVVLGYELWNSAFAGDPGVVGKNVQLGGTSPVVVGVMPKGFRFPFNDQLWVPLRDDRQVSEPLEGPAIFVFGRLRDGMNRAAAQAELDVLGRAAAAESPDSHGLLRPQVGPYGVNQGWSGPTLVFAGMQLVMVLLLIIICSTVGALVFVRNLSREGEIAMRLALGASRKRIVTQLFAESVVMASLASALGLVFAIGGLRWVNGMFAASQVGDGGLPFWFQSGLAQGTAYYVVVLTLLSAGVTGLLPALSVTGRRSHSPLRRLPSDRGSFHLSPGATATIAGQSALTIALLTLVSGLWPGMIGANDAGETIDGSLYLTAELRPGGQPPRTREERGPIYDRFLESTEEIGRRLRTTPEVAGVTFASALPGTRRRDYRIEVEGRAQGRSARDAPSSWVDVHYFDVLGVPRLAGRTFEPEDFEGAPATRPVAIVNQSFAREWFGDENPIGQRIRPVGSNHANDPLSEIVGVVGDIGMSLTDRARPSAVYFPLRTGTYPLRVAVQLRTSPGLLTSRLRAISAEVDPLIRVGSILMLDAIFDRAHARQRAIYMSALLATFSVLALSLSAIYAMMSLLVARRTREIGIRRALGGRASQIVVDVLSQSVAKVGMGVALGIALMWLLRLVTMASVSWGVLTAVSIATLGVGLLACVGPAVRAASVNPLEAIRSEW